MKDLRAIRFIPGTKISHDYNGDTVTTFSYRELIGLNTEAIGIPCKQNGIIVIDVDVAGANHKKDGTQWWENFRKKNTIPETYTVGTPSGGRHYYFKMPDTFNTTTFSPPGQLAPGVDVKWNGWVGAPPTFGYTLINGNVGTMAETPLSLILYMAQKTKGISTKEFDGADVVSLDLHKPFTDAQMEVLKRKLEWVSANASMSYHEWRDGLFALKAGIDDPALLDEYAHLWTFNRAYQPGDEHKASEIIERANKHGGVGPGTIFGLIQNIERREGAPALETPWTAQEIIDKSKIPIGFNKDGSIKVDATEANASALIGAIFSKEDLYQDTRSGHYVFKGVSYSDVDLVNILIPMIQSSNSGLGFTKFKKSVIAGGLDVLLQNRKVDPHQEFLKSVVWDGVPRIEQFFQKYASVPDCEYIRLVGKNLWTALAARGMDPGCKFDSMVVLEGHEGIRKSSLIEAIGGEYTFVPFNPKAFQNLDDLRQMHQAIVVELPELIGIINQPSEQVKAFLSKPFDDIRPLFAKRAMKNLRSFIFIGSTNSSRYLQADMGARRFWPVRIPNTVDHIDLTGIKVDRGQLFAEGVHYYRAKHPYYFMPVKLLEALIEERVIDEPLVTPISDSLKMVGESFTSFEIYKLLETASVVPKGLTKAVVCRIEDALSRVGCTYDAKNHKWSQAPEPSLDMFV